MAIAIVIRIMRTIHKEKMLPFPNDWHCHCLPAMDDGAKNPDISLAMLQALHSQGIQAVMATPHYYAHRESQAAFLKRRQKAIAVLLEQIKTQAVRVPHLTFAAEVHLEREISKQDLTPLANEDGILLLELPFQKYKPWMLEEIENIVYGTNLTLMLAHVERYLPFYSAEDYREILHLEQVVFQVNTSFVKHFQTRYFLKQLRKLDLPLVLGSDAHNMQNRPPEFGKAQRYARFIGASETKFSR